MEDIGPGWSPVMTDPQRLSPPTLDSLLDDTHSVDNLAYRKCTNSSASASIHLGERRSLAKPCEALGGSGTWRHE